MSQQSISASALVMRAIEKAGTASELARYLNAPRSSISFWKDGRRPVPDDVIAELAAYVGEDPIKALAKTSGGRWKRIAQGITAGVAPTVLVIALLGLTSSTAYATNGNYQTSSVHNHCILCKPNYPRRCAWPGCAI